MSRERIVIIGASLAGATAAAALREGGFDGDLQLIGAESQLPYNRPPLSKGYLRGQDRFEDQLVHPASFYAAQHIGLRLEVRATAIDPKRKVVGLDGGEEIAYDRALVTTGGRNRTLSVPGADLEGILQLRTVEDCDRIRAVAKTDGELKIVGKLIRNRVRVDPMRLADEEVDLDGLAAGYAKHYTMAFGGDGDKLAARDRLAA